MVNPGDIVQLRSGATGTVVRVFPKECWVLDSKRIIKGVPLEEPLKVYPYSVGDRVSFRWRSGFFHGVIEEIDGAYAWIRNPEGVFPAVLLENIQEILN